MKSTRLTNYEKETIVLLNESNDPVQIYTHNPKLIKRIMERNSEYPELFKITKVGQDGDITCQLPKNKLSITLLKPLSEEEIQRRSNLGKMSKNLKSYKEPNVDNEKNI